MKWILAVLSTFLALVILEGGLRFYYHSHLNYSFEMWQYAQQFHQGVEDLRSHIHRPQTKGQVMGHVLSINSAGFRDREFEPEPKQGTYRILSLGDSFTLGFGVAAEETFSKLLERELSQADLTVEVINAGVGNYNTSQQLESLQRQGLKFHPHHLLLNIFLNDAEKTQVEEAGLGWTIYFLFASLPRRLGKMNFLGRYQNSFTGESWNTYQRTLTQIHTITQQQGIKLTVSLLPDLRQLSPYPFLAIHRKLIDFFKQHNIMVIDTLHRFTNLTHRHYWVAEDDPHPNSAAHRIIASEIARQMDLRMKGPKNVK